MKTKLQDSVFMITGASSGIGREVAPVMAEKGCRLSLGARNVERLKETAREARALGGEMMVVPTDVTERSQVEYLVQKTMDCWGKIDGLVSNAGQYIQVPILKLTQADLEQSLAVNFYSHVYAVQAICPGMIRQGSGHIILVSSLDAKKGIPGDAPYVSAKCALGGFGDVLRQELRPLGIAVTLVFPGRVDTPMISHLKVPPVSAKMPAEVVARAIVRAVSSRPAEVIVPRQAGMLYLLNVFLPNLADWLVRKWRLEGEINRDL